MPWWGTQGRGTSVDRGSSESRLATWNPGMPGVPLRVMRRKPRPSAVSRLRLRAPRPETTSASFGSATRQNSLNRTATTMIARTVPTAIRTTGESWDISGSSEQEQAPFRGSGRGCRSVPLDAHHDHVTWGVVVDDQHECADRHRLGIVVGAGVERFAATPYGDHDLADHSGRYPPGDPADFADHAPHPLRGTTCTSQADMNLPLRVPTATECDAANG